MVFECVNDVPHASCNRRTRQHIRLHLTCQWTGYLQAFIGVHISASTFENHLLTRIFHMLVNEITRDALLNQCILGKDHSSSARVIDDLNVKNSTCICLCFASSLAKMV